MNVLMKSSKTTGLVMKSSNMEMFMNMLSMKMLKSFTRIRGLGFSTNL
jgi:hypothetical protein